LRKALSLNLTLGNWSNAANIVQSGREMTADHRRTAAETTVGGQVKLLMKGNL
jgi:hypothetical protein